MGNCLCSTENMNEPEEEGDNDEHEELAALNSAGTVKNSVVKKHPSWSEKKSVKDWDSLAVDELLDTIVMGLPSLPDSHSDTLSFIDPQNIFHEGWTVDDLFKPVQILGRGVSCVVGEVLYCGKNPTKIGQRFALKRIGRDKSWTAQLFRKEVSILRILTHPNIVALDDVYMDDNYFYICTKLCSGGDLLNRIYQMDAFSEKDAATIIKTLLWTLRFMHSQNIVHRDIKPGNIVFDQPGAKGKPVIIDFGDALEVSHDENTKYDKVCGTVAYLPPESVKHARTGPHLKKGDIWAVGIIAYILVTGGLPFAKKMSESEVLGCIRDWEDVHLTFPKTHNLSDNCKECISALLRKDSRLRASAEEALLSPWLGDIGSISDDAFGPHVMADIQTLHKAQVLKKIFLQGFIKQMTKEQMRWLMDLFRSVDNADRGYVDERDIMKWLCCSGFKTREARKRTDEILQLLDTNNDGKITYHSFLNAYANVRLTKHASAAITDALGDISSERQIDVEALRAHVNKAFATDKTTLEEAHKALDTFAVDPKGMVKLDDFIDAIQVNTDMEMASIFTMQGTHKITTARQISSDLGIMPSPSDTLVLDRTNSIHL